LRLSLPRRWSGLSVLTNNPVRLLQLSQMGKFINPAPHCRNWRVSRLADSRQGPPLRPQPRNNFPPLLPRQVPPVQVEHQSVLDLLLLRQPPAHDFGPVSDAQLQADPNPVIAVKYVAILVVLHRHLHTALGDVGL